MTSDLYQGLWEKIPESLIVSDEQDDILLVNQRTEQLFGYARDELMGRQVSMLITEPPHDRRCAQQRVDLPPQHQPDARSLTSGRHKNGNGFPVEISLARLEGLDGTRNLRIVRDVSERERVEKVLRGSERRYQQLYDHAPDMYFTVAEDGMIRSVNLLGARCLGFSHEELVGRPVWHIVHPQDLSRIRAQVDGIFKNRRTESELEFRKVCKDGSVLWVHEQVRLFEGGGDAPPELWISCRDITERKEAEAALRHAKGQAERANAAKTRFLSAVNHDLRQPLQTMGLLIGVLKERAQDPKTVQELAGDLGETLSAMGDLLDGLLDAERLEAGGVAPRVTEFRLGSLFDRMRICFENQASRKGLSLHLVRSDAMIRSDPVLLGRIVQNLLSNAIRYTDRGRILLGCRRHGSQLRIEVWDTGPGIAKPQQAMIFEDHYQIGNTARDRRKGLGLGLAIVRRTASLLGHHIELRSRIGRGSMFAVEVPRIAETPKHRIEPAPGRSQPHGSRLPDVSVLLIEDDQAVLRSTRLLLEVLGCRVATATSSREALQQLTRQSAMPDLIISDYRLPEGELGTHAIQRLRTATAGTLPAILITGDTTLAVQRESERFDCRILRKPVDAASLAALIHRLVDPQPR